MQIIPIQALPIQRFQVPLDNNEWDVTIRLTNGVISFSFTLNGTVILENMRAVAGRRIIPSKYEESGNFTLITQNFEIPDYMQFGITQQLIYISADELATLRIPNDGIITAADFDPNGALPLRFKPQGYSVAGISYVAEDDAGVRYITESGNKFFVIE